MRRVLTIVAAFALIGPSLASAESPPAQVPIQGYVSEKQDNSEPGKPLDGEVEMAFTIYNAQTGGDAVAEGTTKMVMVRKGAFSTYLKAGDFDNIDDSKALLALFRDNTNLWVEISVDGEPIEPRLRLATVPYAANANYAETAAAANSLSGDAADSYQEKLSEDNCESGQHAVGINADGTVKCSAVPTVSTGHGLRKNNGELEVNYSGVSGLDCSGDKKVSGLKQDGTPICSRDIRAGAGQSLSYDNSGDLDLDLSSATTRCNRDEKVVALKDDGSVVCSSDAKGVESLTAGDGLSNSGSPTQPSLDVSVSSNQIQTGAVTSNEIQNGSVTGSDIDSSTSVTAKDYNYDTPKTRRNRIPVAEFSLRSNDEDDVWEINRQYGYGEITNALGDGKVNLQAPLDVPTDAELTQLKCWVRDYNSSSNGTDYEIDGNASIQRANPYLGASSEEVASISLDTSSGPDSGTVDKSTTINNYRVTQDDFYILNVDYNPGGDHSYLKFMGCEVQYEVASAGR